MSNKALPPVAMPQEVFTAQLKAMGDSITKQLRAVSDRNLKEIESINHKLGTQDQGIKHLKGHLNKLNEVTGVKRAEKGEADNQEDLAGGGGQMSAGAIPSGGAKVSSI